jgi:hypothetical protein
LDVGGGSDEGRRAGEGVSLVHAHVAPPPPRPQARHLRGPPLFPRQHKPNPQARILTPRPQPSSLLVSIMCGVHVLMMCAAAQGRDVVSRQGRGTFIGSDEWFAGCRNDHATRPSRVLHSVRPRLLPLCVCVRVCGSPAHPHPEGGCLHGMAEGHSVSDSHSDGRRPKGGDTARE